MSETSPEPVAIPLAERAVIAVSGADSPRFLQDILTADIARLKPGGGTLAALLTPQGKIVADMLVFDASDNEPLYLIDVARGLATDIAAKLTHYRLRAAVEVNLLAEPIAVMAVFDAPPVSGETFYTFSDPRDSSLGQRLIGPMEALLAGIPDISAGDSSIFHKRRVALGIPETGKDYAPNSAFPHEANLDQLGGVDFAKGCYIGQEIVSRMEHRGTARTRALCARFLNGFGVNGGAEIAAGERVIGTIGECYGDRAIALVRLDRLADARAAGETLTAGGVGVELTRPAYGRFQIAETSSGVGA